MQFNHGDKIIVTNRFEIRGLYGQIGEFISEVCTGTDDRESKVLIKGEVYTLDNAEFSQAE